MKNMPVSKQTSHAHSKKFRLLFRSLEGSSREAEKSLAQLLGLVVSSQTELKLVFVSEMWLGMTNLAAFLKKIQLKRSKTAVEGLWKFG